MKNYYLIVICCFPFVLFSQSIGVKYNPRLGKIGNVYSLGYAMNIKKRIGIELDFDFTFPKKNRREESMTYDSGKPYNFDKVPYPFVISSKRSAYLGWGTGLYYNINVAKNVMFSLGVAYNRGANHWSNQYNYTWSGMLQGENVIMSYHIIDTLISNVQNVLSLNGVFKCKVSPRLTLGLQLRSSFTILSSTTQINRRIFAVNHKDSSFVEGIPGKTRTNEALRSLQIIPLPVFRITYSLYKARED